MAGGRMKTEEEELIFKTGEPVKYFTAGRWHFFDLRMRNCLYYGHLSWFRGGWRRAVIPVNRFPCTIVWLVR